MPYFADIIRFFFRRVKHELKKLALAFAIVYNLNVIVEIDAFRIYDTAEKEVTGF